MTYRRAAQGIVWGAATDRGEAPQGSADDGMQKEGDARPDDPNFVDDLDVGMALMAALTSRDMGEPVVELNLSALTPAERKAVLALLQRRLEIGTMVGNPSQEPKSAALNPESPKAQP